MVEQDSQAVSEAVLRQEEQEAAVRVCDTSAYHTLTTTDFIPLFLASHTLRQLLASGMPSRRIVSWHGLCV